MKLAVVVLFLCTATVFAPCAAAQDEARLVQQRIDALEDEQSRNIQQSLELGGHRAIKDSISAVTNNRDAVSRQIQSLDAAVQQMRTTRDEVAQMRAQRDDKNIYTREDGREELYEHIGTSIALIGLSEAAKSYTGLIGGALFVGESVLRYSWKLETLEQLDELLATIDRNLGELRELRLKFQADRGVHMQKLAELEQLRRRDMQVFRELAEARAQLARLQSPPPAAPPAPEPIAATPPPAPRKPVERTVFMPTDLAGAWTGSGYGCNGERPDEAIFIRPTADGELVATKSSGDECIRAGEVTWTGRLEGKVIRARFHVRAPGAPANADSWIDGTLEVISTNEIRGFGVRFHRPGVR